MKQTKAITLISLVITVVVLLIISGVAISIATNGNGIFGKAEEARDKWNNKLTEEEQILADLNEELKYVANTKNIPNSPVIRDGMTPIKFTLPVENTDTVGTVVETSRGDSDWYNYDEKRWANAQTEDGSMWVWIPRYAYRIDKTDSEHPKTEVVFLIQDTDYYYDAEGNKQKAKRCTSATDPVDTTTGFTVHPAFTNESSSAINYRNGGWNKELYGIWVAKFEAGYAGGNNKAPVKASNVNYEQPTVWGRYMEVSTTATSDGPISARNWLDGIYGETTTAIKYPTFQPLTYSMNYINHSDAYELALDMTAPQNIYGFDSSEVDTHLMKDSEWGMVAYFSQSQYGLNGITDIAVNNINLNNGQSRLTKAEGNQYASVYAVTGVTRGSNTEGEYQAQSPAEFLKGASNNTASSTDSVYTWNQYGGRTASSSGNMYGIYDLSGGVWERTASYVANKNDNLKNYGTSLAWDGTKFLTSTEHRQVYAYGGAQSGIDEESEANYKANKLVYGNAMYETSTAGTGRESWYSDYSYFPGLHYPFSIRGGSLWSGGGAGLFSFYRHGGDSAYSSGFRPVVVAL